MCGYASVLEQHETSCQAALAALPQGCSQGGVGLQGDERVSECVSEGELRKEAPGLSTVQHSALRLAR